MSSNVEDADFQSQMKELFSKVDKNNDGIIQFGELKEALMEMSFIKNSSKHNKNNKITQNLNEDDAKSLYNRMKSDSKSETLNFRDFVDYVSQVDKKIELVFQNLDADKDGIIDANEIKQAFAKLEICLSDKDVEKLINHIKSDKSLRIDKKEWKNFFRFAPHDELEQMLRYWRKESFVDYGDQLLPNDYTKEEKESGLWWRNLIGGGISGVITRTFTAPLDRVKIFMQVHGSESQMHIVSAIRNMVKEGGILALWRGNGMSVVKVAPECALKQMVYEEIKRAMGKDGQTLPPWQKFISGSMAGFMAQSTIYPMEVLKTRLALRTTGQYSGVFDCMRKIYKLEGMKAFYRGYLINAMGILPAAGVDLALYEHLKTKHKQAYPDNPHPSALTVLLFANISAASSMFSSYPLYLIRTRLQSSTNPSDNITSIAKTIWKNEGVIGFYHGALANLIKFAPAASIGYIAFEQYAHYLGLKS